MKNIALFTFGFPDKLNRVKFIFSLEEAKWFKKEGCHIEVFDLSPDKSLYPSNTTEEFEGVITHRIPQVSVFNFKYLKTLIYIRNLCKKGNFDIILYSFIRYLFLPIQLFSSSICKKALHCQIAHGSDAMLLWMGKISRFLNKLSLCRMDYIFARSENTENLVKTVIKPENYKKISVVYNGLDKDKFKAVENYTCLDARKHLNIPFGKKIILTICDLVPRKGIDILVKADAILKDSGVDFQHIIIGRGPEKDNLLSLVNNKGLTQDVIFIDYVSDDRDIGLYYIACDVYSMISRTFYAPPAIEGFGVSYIEAEYFGKPVVGGNTGGVPSAVKDYATGFLVDPEKEDCVFEIKDKIYKLLSDQELYNQFSRNAKQFVLDNFDWAFTVRKVLSICEKNR